MGKQVSRALGGSLGAEGNLLRLRDGVFTAEVAVGLHRESPAIFMAEPAGDGWNIDAALNADGREKVTQVVVGDSRHADFLRSPIHRLLAFPHLEDWSVL